MNYKSLGKKLAPIFFNTSIRDRLIAGFYFFIISSVELADISSIQHLKIFKWINFVINQKISVESFIYFIVLITLLYILLNKIFKREKRNQNLLKKFNSKDIGNGIKVKWNVRFYSNGTPFIPSITAFCTLHGEVPLKLLLGNCTVVDCQNRNIQFNYPLIENAIESELLAEWELINS